MLISKKYIRNEQWSLLKCKVLNWNTDNKKEENSFTCLYFFVYIKITIKK